MGQPHRLDWSAPPGLLLATSCPGLPPRLAGVEARVLPPGGHGGRPYRWWVC